MGIFSLQMHPSLRGGRLVVGDGDGDGGDKTGTGHVYSTVQERWMRCVPPHVNVICWAACTTACHRPMACAQQCTARSSYQFRTPHCAAQGAQATTAPIRQFHFPFDSLSAKQILLFRIRLTLTSDFADLLASHILDTPFLQAPPWPPLGPPLVPPWSCSSSPRHRRHAERRSSLTRFAQQLDKVIPRKRHAALINTTPPVEPAQRNSNGPQPRAFTPHQRGASSRHVVNAAATDAPHRRVRRALRAARGDNVSERRVGRFVRGRVVSEGGRHRAFRRDRCAKLAAGRAGNRHEPR